MKKVITIVFTLSITILLCSCSGLDRNRDTEIYDYAYNEGYEDGYDEGQSSGYNGGYDDGYAAGAEELESARHRSYSDGYKDGISDAANNMDFDSDYEEWKEEGYYEGYADAEYDSLNSFYDWLNGKAYFVEGSFYGGLVYHSFAEPCVTNLAEQEFSTLFLFADKEYIDEWNSYDDEGQMTPCPNCIR